MFDASSRRCRHRKRPRNMAPMPPGMFFVPYGHALPYDGSSTSSSSASSSYSESESEDDEQVTKKMLTEMRSLRKTTETLLTRQRDLQQKLENHLKASVSRARTKSPIRKAVPTKKTVPTRKASPIKKPIKKPAPAKLAPSPKSTLTMTTRGRGPPPVIARKQPKKDVTRKRKKVTKNHVLQVIASQAGYNKSLNRAAQAYDKLLGLAKKEVATMQAAMGTPGRCTETFGSDLVVTHRLRARKNLEQAALSSITPRVDLAICQDSWATDYILRRTWETFRYKDKRQQSEEADGEESDSTGRASRVPEVRSES